MVVSPPLGAVPSDGVLHIDVDPVAEGGWFEGPVPVFVDLTLMDGDDADPRFTVVSNTLATLVDIARTSRTQRPDELCRAAKRWLHSMVDDGSPPAGLLARLDEITGQRKHFVVLVSADRSADDTAYYGVSCSGGFFALPLTEKQADAAGVGSDSLEMGAALGCDPAVRGHLAHLRKLQVTSSTGGGISGTVIGEFRDPMPKNLKLRSST
jgi:hypothetical protein